jgi:DNA-binding NarL/FixJ family response regulator
MRLFDKLHHVMIAIRVLVLSDDTMIHAGLSEFLSGEETIEVVGHVALTEVEEGLLDVYQPDVLLVDDGNNIPTLRQQLHTLDIPYIRLVDEWTIHSKSSTEPSTLQRNVDLSTLSAALHAVAAGLRVFPQYEGFIPSNQRTLEYPFENLTARETEVLQLIGRGLTNRAIGQELSIKESTVKYHVNGILAKLGAQSRTEALSIASRIGWIIY